MPSFLRYIPEIGHLRPKGITIPYVGWVNKTLLGRGFLRRSAPLPQALVAENAQGSDLRRITVSSGRLESPEIGLLRLVALPSRMAGMAPKDDRQPPRLGLSRIEDEPQAPGAIALHTPPPLRPDYARQAAK